MNMFERADWRVLGDWDRENNPSYCAWYELVVHGKIPKEVPLDSWMAEYIKKVRSRMVLGFSVRDHCIQQYSFAVPDEHALNRIAAHSPHGLIEIGPGTGYWSLLLRKKQVWPVLSCDIGPLEERGSRYRGGFKREWTYIRHTPHDKTPELVDPKGMSLFMCWPDMDTWPVEALRRYTGGKLIYIGEGDGGCTADDEYFEELHRNWVLVEYYDIPSWDGIHDHMRIYRRDPNAKKINESGYPEEPHVTIKEEKPHELGEVRH